MKRVEEIRSALEGLLFAMVSDHDTMKVTAEQHGPQVDYRVVVASVDMPRVIGTRGTNFDALSTLVWSMGNMVQPTLKTRLLKIEPAKDKSEDLPEVDAAELFDDLAREMALPPRLDLVNVGQMRGILERSGMHAQDIRAYLLAMRAGELSWEVKRFLQRGAP